MVNPMEKVSDEIIIKLLVNHFNELFDESVEQFIKEKREYFEKNRENIIKKEVIRVFKVFDPSMIEERIWIVLHDISEKNNGSK